MKHLKLFEELTEPTYYELSVTGFYEDRSRYGYVDISQKMFDLIKSHFTLELSLEPSLHLDDKSYISFSSYPPMGIRIIGSIVLTEDDWFYLYIDNKGIRCFKCDQIDGLFDCLKMLDLYK